ncbi:Hypothetical protein I595_3313 [Croceitalea dokdonensis DOKDO 023]|uniref:Uncharacterized protein n=1 Tax=Croceitalea dokdonensis DOKDO 023 TaxID=1300341 RepID=A0A0N8H3G3_9FLAO|nr:hypothetical protein [Croceitalea dokdonensis]KPM30492.1 Hypothetical protein I595_3313 [Croceitalea dokdonensis DOKDO 023]
MNPDSKKIKILMLILLCFSLEGKTQCYKDFFGYWKTDSGKFIKLIEHDSDRNIKGETVIGDKNNHFKGVHFYEDKIFKIQNHEYHYDEKAKKNNSTKRAFNFKVLTVNKQMMRIRPISKDMKKLFGLNDINLWNEYYIPFGNFELDSIFYRRSHLPYEIQIDRNGMMKMAEDLSYKNNKKRYYSGELSFNQLDELKRLIIKSQITSMSVCELENYCSDCYPLRLKIFHNSKLSYYKVGMMHDNAAPLIRYLKKIILETKWKKVKRKKTAANKG